MRSSISGQPKEASLTCWNLLTACSQAPPPVSPPDANPRHVQLVFYVLVRYLAVVMRKKAARRKSVEYPDQTDGTRWAAEARKMASKMSAAERAEHFRQAMVKIYGGDPKEEIGARR